MGRFGHLSLSLLASCAAPVAPLAVGAPTALWSPAEGVLPFPDPAPTTPTDPVRATLARFVAAHHGAPVDAPVAVELSAPVDAASLAGVALVRDDGSRVDADAALTLGGRAVRLVPKQPLDAGRSYTLIVAGLRSTTGERFAKSASFAYAAGDSLDAPPGTEATLDAVKPAVDAALRAAAAAGFAKADVAVASRFTATDCARVDFDVEKHRAPWPSDFATDAGHTTLPPGDLRMLGDAGVAAARNAVASVPGFSTSARIRVPLLGRADDGTGYALYALADARAVDAVTTTLSDDAATVFLERKPALAAASSYAIVVDGAKSGGAPVLPSLDAALLAAGGPLAHDGRSTTALLDDDTARVLDAERTKVAPVVHAIGHDPALVVAFDTLDAFAFVDSYARRVDALEPALSDVVVESPFDRGLWAVMPNVDTVVSGTFTSLDFIDPTTLRATEPKMGAVPFVLIMPKHDGGANVPVVVFGHGLITSKELAYLIGDQLAQAGFATFSIDLPMHGGRTVCLVDAHCDPLETCGADHACHNLDGSSPGSLATASSLFDGGPQIPIATGEAFVLVDDLVASRDHFLQGIVDLRQGLRLLAAGGLDTFAHAQLQRDHLGWLGISLGGIFGAAMSGSTEQIESFALNVPGADLVVTLEDSTVLSPLLAQAMVAHGVAQGSAAYRDYEDLAHLVLDPVDPMNLAPRATVDCPQQWQQKRVILQMAGTDLVVPNSATKVLSEVTGVAISEYHPLVSNHGFLLDPTSIEGAKARHQAIAFLAGGG